MTRKENISVYLIGFALVVLFSLTVAVAQQPSPSPTPAKSDAQQNNDPNPPVEAGEKAGDYTVISSIEFGYRGLSVDGDLN